ncbi:MAG: Anaerobic sulfite reductase subunit B [Desulfovibrio sp.]
MADAAVKRHEIPVFTKDMANPYMPYVATVKEVIRETPNIMTFRVVLDDAEAMKNFHYEPGQVGQLSLFGSGEATFVINSPPTRKEYLQFSVMRAGEVTAALHSLKAGDKVGVRAPLGNHFPYDAMKGKDIVFVGGGIGMAPLRTLLLYIMDNRKDYGKITLLYGARSPQDMAYTYEIPEWRKAENTEVVLTIDREAEGWTEKVGLIPNVLLEMNPSTENSVAVTCGPPIMIKFTLQALDKLGFKPEQIVTTLERRMKCGIGICGRCNIGDKYVCVDGPVFTYAELKDMVDEL